MLQIKSLIYVVLVVLEVLYGPVLSLTLCISMNGDFMKGIRRNHLPFHDFLVIHCHVDRNHSTLQADHNALLILLLNYRVIKGNIQ